MVALNDLKVNDLITIPWYGGKSVEFRIHSDDLTFTIKGGGTQRQISLGERVNGVTVLPGRLLHTIPKRGAASILVGKNLPYIVPREGKDELGDGLTFEGRETYKRITPPVHLSLKGYTIIQALYRMPGNGLLLAERDIPARGSASTWYYKAAYVEEKDIQRK